MSSSPHSVDPEIDAASPSTSTSTDNRILSILLEGVSDATISPDVTETRYPSVPSPTDVYPGRDEVGAKATEPVPPPTNAIHALPTDAPPALSTSALPTLPAEATVVMLPAETPLAPPTDVPAPFVWGEAVDGPPPPWLERKRSTFPIPTLGESYTNRPTTSKLRTTGAYMYANPLQFIFIFEKECFYFIYIYNIITAVLQ